jgi:hypothetical protein
MWRWQILPPARGSCSKQTKGRNRNDLAEAAADRHEARPKRRPKLSGRPLWRRQNPRPPVFESPPLRFVLDNPRLRRGLFHFRSAPSWRAVLFSSRERHCFGSAAGGGALALPRALVGESAFAHPNGRAWSAGLSHKELGENTRPLRLCDFCCKGGMGPLHFSSLLTSFSEAA